MLHSLLSTILDALLPKNTDAKRASTITETDLQKLFHPRLAREAWIISLFPYSNPTVRALIRGVKFYGITAPLPAVGVLAGEYLLEHIYEKKSFAGWGTPLLIPMPSSQKRMRDRGYNQAERFASALLPTLMEAVEFAPHVLVREERESQTRILREQRKANVAGAFSVSSPEKVLGRQVILIDDVVESAGTMNDARRALINAGAAEVFGVAIAS